MRLKERGEAGEDVCTPFCLHGIFAEMQEHRGRILQSRADVGGTIGLEVLLERKKILVNHTSFF